MNGSTFTDESPTAYIDPVSSPVNQLPGTFWVDIPHWKTAVKLGAVSIVAVVRPFNGNTPVKGFSERFSIQTFGDLVSAPRQTRLGLSTVSGQGRQSVSESHRGHRDCCS